MLIPLEESTTPLRASYSLRVPFAFLYIQCIFKINFLTIITIITCCNMTLDVFEYFFMILIFRTVQKKKLCPADNFQIPIDFWRYRLFYGAISLKTKLNMEL